MARAARAGQQQDAGGARPRRSTRDAPLPKLVDDGRRHKPATGRGKSDRHGGSKASLPGMAAALESGETSAVAAFDAHGKAKASGESKKDFAARRTSWLAAYRQALKRRAAASASVSDGIPAQPTPGAAAAAAAATCPREKDTKLAQKLGQLQPFVAAQPASFGPA